MVINMKNIMDLPANDNQFYPTPPELIVKMQSKIDEKMLRGESIDILDPSAGKGDLLDNLASYFRWRNKNTYAIEIDPHLAIIVKEKHTLLDHDFLQYQGAMMFDLIIMNPPFLNGDQHLLHAMNFVFNGQIICLLNAETIRNPCTKTRIILINKLNELNADIEYIDNAFIDAERTAKVDVALIYIKITNDFDQTYCEELEKGNTVVDFVDGTEVATTDKKNISAYIDEYNIKRSICVNTIFNFFKNSYGARNYLSIVANGNYSEEVRGNNPHNINTLIRNFEKKLKTDYWNKLFLLPEFNNKLTTKKQKEFNEIIRSNTNLEFNRHNINLLYENLLTNWSGLIEDAILNLFDKITYDYSYYDERQNNFHLFNGWKSNNGYKINSRFILPFYGAHKTTSSCRRWETKELLNDIEKVITYFNNGMPISMPLQQIYEQWLQGKVEDNQLENEIIKIKIYKKGTIHFFIKNETILRRFNVFVGKKRQWLPPTYAHKAYKKCSREEKDVINAFEGEKQYTKHFNDPLIKLSGRELLGLTA